MTELVDRSGPIVCFGEILLRLSAPSTELLLQSPQLAAHFGGAEANVAVSLSTLGKPARMVSFLPDNALGHAALGELRRHGVDVSGIRFAPGRMGLYFLTPGALIRPADIIYDRKNSAFAAASPDALDWHVELRGAVALHISGITPALGRAASEAALRASRAARELGVPVSFDGNYRSKLWAEQKSEAPQILKELLGAATIGFVDDRDIALVLARKFDDQDPSARRKKAARAAFDSFPRLERIASTLREQHTVEHHTFSALSFRRDGAEFRTSPLQLVGIVDRIGTGDAFAAALLHSLHAGMNDGAALEFAHGAACLKHATPGDFNLAGEADIKAFLAQGDLDVRR